MPKFEHLRHKAPEISKSRDLIIACAPFKSNINLSTIFRTAGCCGIKKVIATGSAKLDKRIARDGAETVELEVRRSLLPVLKDLKLQGYCLVGLEQTTNSHVLKEYDFKQKTVLVIGSERQGLTQDILDVLDAVVEIPVYGLPYSYNVATATSIALYEYCRQNT